MNAGAEHRCSTIRHQAHIGASAPHSWEGSVAFVNGDPSEWVRPKPVERIARLWKLHWTNRIDRNSGEPKFRRGGQGVQGGEAKRGMFDLKCSSITWRNEPKKVGPGLPEPPGELTRFITALELWSEITKRSEPSDQGVKILALLLRFAQHDDSAPIAHDREVQLPAVGWRVEQHSTIAIAEISKKLNVCSQLRDELPTWAGGGHRAFP